MNRAILLLAGLLVATVFQTGQSYEEDDRFMRACKVYACITDDCKVSPEETKEAMEIALDEIKKKIEPGDPKEIMEHLKQLKFHLSICKLVDGESKKRCESRIVKALQTLEEYNHNDPLFINMISYYKGCIDHLEKFCAEKPATHEDTEEMQWAYTDDEEEEKNIAEEDHEFIRAFRVYSCEENTCLASAEETKKAMLIMLGEMHKHRDKIAKYEEMRNLKLEIGWHIWVCELEDDESTKRCEFKLEQVLDRLNNHNSIGVNLVRYYENCRERLEKFCANNPENTTTGKNVNTVEKPEIEALLKDGETKSNGKAEKAQTERAGARAIDRHTKTAKKEWMTVLSKMVSCFRGRKNWAN